MASRSGPITWQAMPAAAAPQNGIDAADPRVRSDSDDLNQWWKVFNDPVLDDLVCYAYRQNLSLRVAGRAARFAARRRAAKAWRVGNILPQTQNLTGSDTAHGHQHRLHRGRIVRDPAFNTAPRCSTPALFNQYFGMINSNFNLAWELDFWGRFRRDIRRLPRRHGCLGREL